jgi:hypothetical protein
VIPTGRCRECHAPVILARTEAHGRLFLLDPEPNDEGNQAVFGPPHGPLQTRQLGKDDKPRAYETRFMPHVATCTGRKQQAPAELPENAVDLTRARTERRGTKPLNRRRT